MISLLRFWTYQVDQNELPAKTVNLIVFLWGDLISEKAHIIRNDELSKISTNQCYCAPHKQAPFFLGIFHKFFPRFDRLFGFFLSYCRTSSIFAFVPITIFSAFDFFILCILPRSLSFFINEWFSLLFIWLFAFNIWLRRWILSCFWHLVNLLLLMMKTWALIHLSLHLIIKTL